MSSMESMSSEEPIQKSEASDLPLPRKEYTQNAISHTVNQLLKRSLKFQLFKNTYPELYEKNPVHLREIQSQLRLQLEDTFKTIVDENFTEVDLYQSLDVLDNLVKSHTGSSGEEVWRPSGDPEVDIRDHLHQVKLKHKKCLEFTLQTATLQNEALVKIMEEKHEEILKTQASIDRTSRDIKNHFENLNDASIAKLEKKIFSSLHEQAP